MVIAEKVSRTLRSLSTTPLHFRWLNQAALDALQETVREAEKGHDGEIRLLVERSMPLVRAWRQRVRERAEELFDHLRIWDTPRRCGVLVYVNVAERRVELVADEGVRARVDEKRWDGLCDQAAARMQRDEALPALQALLLAVGTEMRDHVGQSAPRGDNVLPDTIDVR